MGKESFLLYHGYYEPIKDLSLEDKGLLFDAIFQYSIEGIEPSNTSRIFMAFQFFKNQMNQDAKKYNRVVERNRNNGKNGGRPKTEDNPENPVGLQKPKKADTDTDTETDTGTDTQKPTFQKDTYPTKKEAFEQMKADQLYIEECLRSLTYRGWTSANDLTVQILLRYFLHTKADIENTRKDMKRHFKNWLNVTQLKNLQEIK